MLRDYSQYILDLFKSAVKGDRKAFKALMTTEKHPELAAFSNAIKGDEKAEVWLRARGFGDWWLMCRALDYDESALKQLQSKDDKFDVSFVLACQNRIEGKYWLVHNENDYSRFLPICQAIAEAVDVKDKERTFWYRIFN
ncbi:MAG: hypothetical protein LBH22_08580 [Bacteroidales bacterium]|jgi:hypothetical protein|nr:hypothetical protein [Bacteroidales bacterium]